MGEDRTRAISVEAKRCLYKLALLKWNTWVSNKDHIGKGVNYHQPSEGKGQNTHCGIPDLSAISLPGHSSQGPWPHQNGRASPTSKTTGKHIFSTKVSFQPMWSGVFFFSYSSSLKVNFRVL